jgi:hypothetical protein
MNDKQKSRSFPRRETEREARRHGWYPGCPVTWREFIEQYPYGRAEITAARHPLESAA